MKMKWFAHNTPEYNTEIVGASDHLIYSNLAGIITDAYGGSIAWMWQGPRRTCNLPGCSLTN